MAIIKFKMSEVAKLAAELKKAKGFSPTMDDLFNPEVYPGGEIIYQGGLDGWPDESKIDRSKLKPSLVLAKDQGIYLMTNADLTGSASERGTVVYAQGCNPDTDEDWYENARYLFGGDDGGITFPAEWYDIAKSQRKRIFQLRLNADSMELA